MQKYRILLADDHQVMREGLKALLQTQVDMEIIGEACNGKETCRKARELKPDVIVLDISMPEMDGVQAAENLKQICPGIKIIVLTAFEDGEYLRQLFKAGAAGYLLKNASITELARAIRCVMDGGVYLDPTMASNVVEGYLQIKAQRANPAKKCGEPAALTSREIEVLRLLAWGHTNREISTQLHLSSHTVETYKARAMEKLELKDRADIVRYALRRGWLKES